MITRMCKKCMEFKHAGMYEPAGIITSKGWFCKNCIEVLVQ